MKYKIKQFLCRYLGVHDWSKRSSFAPYNVADMQKAGWDDQPLKAYTSRRCWECNKEMPHSRNFHNLGIREKNAVE